MAATSVSFSSSVVDSAAATAAAVQEVLDAMQLSKSGGETRHRFLVTDDPDAFRECGESFLGRPLGGVEWIDLQ